MLTCHWTGLDIALVVPRKCSFDSHDERRNQSRNDDLFSTRNEKCVRHCSGWNDIWLAKYCHVNRVQHRLIKSIMSKTKVIHSQRQPRNLKRMLTNSYFSRLKDTDPEVKICGTKTVRSMPLFKTGWRIHLLGHEWNISDRALDELHLNELDLRNNMCRMWK